VEGARSIERCSNGNERYSRDGHTSEHDGSSGHDSSSEHDSNFEPDPARHDLDQYEYEHEHDGATDSSASSDRIQCTGGATDSVRETSCGR
jgi:hypothetical protein